MSEVGASSQYVRLVGGELVFSVITDTSSMRIENLRRVSKPQMHWHFRQPRLALIWFRKGCERLRATIDGRSVDHIFTSKSNLAIVPALSEIQGEWAVGPSLDYTVVFLERALSRTQLSGCQFSSQPNVGRVVGNTDRTSVHSAQRKENGPL
jgi:AraC family transcriptional regulator